MIYRNDEHYYDPTAGEAIANVMREERLPDNLDRENLEDMAIAIIVQAAQDYRKARRRLARKRGQQLHGGHDHRDR